MAGTRSGLMEGAKNIVHLQGWQESSHLNHDVCCPGYTLAENWSQELELGIEHRYSSTACKHHNDQAKCPSRPPFKWKSTQTNSLFTTHHSSPSHLELKSDSPTGLIGASWPVQTTLSSPLLSSYLAFYLWCNQSSKNREDFNASPNLSLGEWNSYYIFSNPFSS